MSQSFADLLLAIVEKSRSFAYHPRALPQRAQIAHWGPHEENAQGPCAQDDSIVVGRECNCDECVSGR